MKPTLFSDLGLSTELEKAIKRLGFEQASPIQAAAIPVLMDGKDVVGQSQTGSGKTAAFGIPAIEKTDPKKKAVQVLVLCPTRELAVQVSEEIHKLSHDKRGILCIPIYGGQSYERQFAGLRQGAQIVIGTPGRVMDHMRRGTLKLDQLHSIILDEADVMLDMGFREDIEMILEALPEDRQTVFFSATMPRPIRNLIEQFAREPETIKIQQEAMTVPTVEQSVFEVERRFKVELLTRLIDVHDLKLGIIFCNTKSMVDDLVEHLVAQGYQADRLHGDMSQAQRDRVMNRFRKSSLEFLVATDVAARGIDVDDVEVVFNYDIPYDPEDYVHRIGRTGRAGRSGIAISFASGRELFKIKHIERFTKTRIRRGKIPTLQDVDAARNNHVLNKVRETLAEEDYHVQDPLVECLLDEGFASTDIAAALLHQLQASESNVSKKGQRDELAERYAERDNPRSRSGRRRKWEDQGDRGDRGGSRDRSREERPRMREDRPRSRRGRSDDQEEGFWPKGRRKKWEDTSSRPSRREERAESSQSPEPGEKEKPKPEKKKERSLKAEMVQKRDQEEKPAKKTFSEEKPLPPSLESKPATKADPEKVTEPKDTLAPKAPKSDTSSEAAAAPSKPRTKQSRSRFRLGEGKDSGVSVGKLREAILKATSLPADALGKIDLQSKHAVIEVSSDQAKLAVSKMKRTTIAGKRVKAKLA